MTYNTLQEAKENEFNLWKYVRGSEPYIEHERIDTMRIKERMKLEEEHPDGRIVCITKDTIHASGIYLLWNSDPTAKPLKNL